MSRERALLVVAALVGGLVAGCKPPHFNGTPYDPPEPAPSIVLDRADGAKLNLAELHGSVVLVLFGYTHCPDVCPTTLLDWHRIRDSLGADAARTRFVFVSVDPARDDPASLGRFVGRFDKSFVGVTGDSVTLARLESAFHVTSSRDSSSSANGYAVVHASQTFVIDPRGRVRLLYPFGMPPELIAADVEELLHGS